MKRNRGKHIGASLGLLAAALMAGPAAQACSLAAWDASPTGNPQTGGPLDTPAIKRYSGACGLAPAVDAASFVAESTQHAAEGGAAPLRVRFFVYTGLTAGTPTIFKATTADAGAGSSVVEVVYDAVDQNFDFVVNGAAAGSTTAGTAPRDRWVRVNFTYQASSAFAASTRLGDTTTALTTSAVANANTIESVQLGVIAPGGAAGSLYFDEYESSRAPGTTADPFTMRCRGDTDNTGDYELGDIFGVIDEFLRTQGDSSRSLAAGQPDIDENGVVDLTDIFGVVDAFLARQGGGGGCI